MPLPVILVAAVVVWSAWGVAHAQVPRAEDIAACNTEAQDAVSKGSASRDAAPNTKDEARAAVARRDGGSGQPGGAAARAADPQLEGMDAEGAKSPVYQAVYRTCMRRGGF
jgi:hypothetical protein